MWTASSEVARGVRGCPRGGLWTSPGSFSVQVASVVNDSPACPISSGALPCTFLPQSRAVPSDQQWPPKPHLLQASQPPAPSFISESPALDLRSVPLRASSTPASLASWLRVCVHTLPTHLSSFPDCRWLSGGSQSPDAEIIRRLSQLVSSSQTSFSFNSSQTSLSDSLC